VRNPLVCSRPRRRNLKYLTATIHPLRRGLVVYLILLSFGLVSCRTISVTAPANVTVEATTDSLLSSLPPLQREFRAAWVATVDNIDWPSEPGLSTSEQKAEMRRLLDRAVDLNLNAIIFQVRPTADAFYDSPFEPWSAYLSGVQGRAPRPYYDPLAFAVEEAHRRGLELHAWFNPFRAYHPTADSVFADLHASQAQRTVPYGSQLWMDPGREDVVSYSLRVIFDVVERYDIDGVHLDDYFYPYPVRDEDGRAVDFPDDASWGAAGDSLARANWRRANVDRFVERLYRGVKERKRWVKVGISPFGIWKPGHPESITGFDPVEKLYADARLWLQKGWVDYFTPQLYWSLKSTGQNYGLLLSWWIEQNTMGRNLWPGLFASRVILEDRRHWPASEIVDQVLYTQRTAGATGNILFSMKALFPGAADLADSLATEAYPAQAIVPASPWLDSGHTIASHISVNRIGESYRLLISEEGEGQAAFLWAVRALRGNKWTLSVLPGWKTSMEFGHSRPDAVAVSAISRTGREGRISILGGLNE
jgi:uncharacterized lipoprotein YddW (UPF0748 family)